MHTVAWWYMSVDPEEHHSFYYNIALVDISFYLRLGLQGYWYMYMCLCTQIIIDSTWLIYICTCTVYTDDSTRPLVWWTRWRFYNATPLLTFYSVWIFPTLVIIDITVLDHEFLLLNAPKWNKQVQWKVKKIEVSLAHMCIKM